MEENEIMLLKNSKMYVTRVGNRMNVFSILTVIGTLFLAVGGIALLFMSNMLPEDTPFYIDNIMGLAGLGLLVLAVAIVPAVVYMRRAMRMARGRRVGLSSMMTTSAASIAARTFSGVIGRSVIRTPIAS